MRSFVGRLFQSQVSGRAAFTLTALVALAWSTLAFCDEIHDAVKDGDLAKIQALLKADPDLVFSKDSVGRTPLHLAASRGNKGVAALLLASKADAEAQDNGGRTPLHYAAFTGHKDVAELLLVSKADVNAEDNDGWTPLRCATVMHQKDVAKLLRQYGGQQRSAEPVQILHDYLRQTYKGSAELALGRSDILGRSDFLYDFVSIDGTGYTFTLTPVFKDDVDTEPNFRTGGYAITTRYHLGQPQSVRVSFAEVTRIEGSCRVALCPVRLINDTGSTLDRLAVPRNVLRALRSLCPNAK